MGGVLRKVIGQDGLPIGMVAALALAAVLGNLWAGLAWTPSLPLLLALPALCLGGAVFYRLYRPHRPAIADGLLYFALWSIYSLFAVRLSYMGLMLGFPFQDQLFTAWDAALGFHWGNWAKLITSHPTLNWFLAMAYESNGWQILATVLILAGWAPGRNRDLMVAIVLALAVTLAIAIAMPARGIVDRYGFHPEWQSVIDQIRRGEKGPLPYTGILFFPSFHTATAVLVAVAHRGCWSFWPFLLASAALIASVPFPGAHYLVDAPAGIVVAASAHGLGFILRRQSSSASK